MNYLKLHKEIFNQFEKREKSIRISLLLEDLNNMEDVDLNISDNLTVCALYKFAVDFELDFILCLDDLCWVNAIYYFYVYKNDSLVRNTSYKKDKIQKYYEAYCNSDSFQKIKEEVLDIAENEIFENYNEDYEAFEDYTPNFNNMI